MTVALLVVQVISCLAIIVLVLLHSGRGSGLSDMLGGGTSTAAAGSTVVERNLDRYTLVFVVIFVFTTMALSIRFQ